MIGCDRLLDKVRRYAPDADVAVVQRAFALSQQAEPQAAGAARVDSTASPTTGAGADGGPSGGKDAGKDASPWRPLGVAELLADLRLDVDTLAAGMVFPAVEGQRLGSADVAAQLGDDIAGIVAGAQRLSRVNYRSSAQEQAEAFRRMILAMARDLRALLVRLADRLYTLQVLPSLDPADQRRFAQETLDIYAPIANRLGIQTLRVQFEDRALAVLQPDEYRQIDEFLRQRREIDQRFIQRVERELLELARAHDDGAVVSGRTKHRAAILQKMRNRSLRLDEVADLVGFRVLVGEPAACYAVLGDVHGRWELVHERFRDYIGRPKNNGYQSLQTTLLAAGGERFEVQIRTHEMHRVAEMGVAAHWRYKEGHLALSPAELEQYTRINQLTRLLDEIKDAQELVDVLKVDLFADEIYVHTPQGDVKWLPLGATALDFAFSIHTDVGLRCAGARVNGQLVPLRYKLQSGDRVEILTRKAKQPGRDWTRLAFTSRARAKIRAHFKAEQRQQAHRQGCESLEKELNRRGLKLSRVQRAPSFARALEQLKVRDADELFSRIGYGTVQLERVIRTLIPEEPAKTPAVALPASPAVPPARGPLKAGAWPVQVQGMHGIMTAIARCCRPLPGEPIVGYITRGRGVTVHRPDCPQARRLDPERMVSVSWSPDSGAAHTVQIRVLMADRPGVLAAVTRRIGLMKINVVSCNVWTGDDAYSRAAIGLAVRDLDQLADAVKKLAQVKGVVAVERL